MPIVYISLGSNIEPEQHLNQAVALLAQSGRLIACSAVYQTSPQGYADQPDFLNMAVCLETQTSIEAFKDGVIGRIERELKRVRDPLNKNAPRTIDLDIALWDGDSRDYGSKPWHVPDPDITRFAHVALPLAEIAPDYIHPENGKTLAELAQAFIHSPVIIRRDVRVG